MDPSKLKLRNLWIAAPALLLLLSFVIWPDFGRTAVHLWNVVALVVICLFVAIWIATYFVGRIASRRTPVALREGSEIAVEVTDSEMVITDENSGKKRTISWNQLEEVSVVAVDHFSIGGISYLFKLKREMIEVPWDAEGSINLLSYMQESLESFDSEALIKASTMLHGEIVLWQRRTTAVQ